MTLAAALLKFIFPQHMLPFCRLRPAAGFAASFKLETIKSIICNIVTESYFRQCYNQAEDKKRKVIKMSTVKLSSNNFDNVVIKANKPVLIDFWASWCGPCRMQSPVVEEVSSEVGNSAVVAKLNVDEEPEIAAKFSVMSIPTLIVVKDGKVASQRIGVTPKETLVSMLRSAGA